jgi:hypothetical protein
MDKIYNIGAAIVILGALFKIEHITIGPLTGGMMLTIGLVTEAIIFLLSAFEKDETEKEKEDEAMIAMEARMNGVITHKIDKLLEQANLDVALIDKLSNNLENLNNASEALSDSVKVNILIKEYNNEIYEAIESFSILNKETKLQMKSVNKNVTVNSKIVEKSEDVSSQMNLLESNLKVLNEVYQGMLLSMGKNNSQK